MNSATPEKLSLRVRKAGYLSHKVLLSPCIKSMKLAKKFKVILAVMSLVVLKTVKRSKRHDGCEERYQFWRSPPCAVSSSDREEFNTVVPRSTDTRLIRTPAYNGQFCLSRQTAHIFSLKLTRFIRTTVNTDNGHFSVSRVTNSHILSTPLYGYWLSAHCPTCLEMTANWEKEFFSSLSASTSQNSPHIDSDEDIIEVNAASKEPKVKSLKEAYGNPGGRD